MLKTYGKLVVLIQLKEVFLLLLQMVHFSMNHCGLYFVCSDLLCFFRIGSTIPRHFAPVALGRQPGWRVRSDRRRCANFLRFSAAFVTLHRKANVTLKMHVKLCFKTVIETILL